MVPISTTRRFWLWLGFWAFVGLFFASQAVLMSFPERAPVPWVEALTINLPFYLLWGLLAPWILALITQRPPERLGPLRFLLLHLVVGAVVSAAQLVAVEGLYQVIRLARGQATPFLQALGFSFRYNFHMNVITYAGIVGAKLAFDWHRRAQEKELVTSKLREQLARAELATLKMQLQPHFLFNTLNSISALVHVDPAAADRMLVRLSDLLRASLESNGENEVALARELELTERYLEIERIRFQDRMTIERRVDPAVLEARVPSFVLQPLVENAIRHGLARRAQAGRIGLRASRRGAELVIDVEDDGPGWNGKTAGRPGGVGLANTRARLAQLYGTRARLDLMDRPGGGAIARLVLPFEGGTK